MNQQAKAFVPNKFANKGKAIGFVFLSIASQSAQASMFIDLTDWLIYHATFYTICTVGMTRAYYFYRRSSFLNNDIYVKHRRLWFSLTVFFTALTLVPPTLMSSTLHYTHWDWVCCSWRYTPTWAIILLTVTLAPAIYQNSSDIGIGGNILVSGNLFLFLYPVISYVSNVILLQSRKDSEVWVLTIVAVIVIQIVIGFAYSWKMDRLKKAYKTLLFSFVYIWLLLWLAVLIYFIYFALK